MIAKSNKQLSLTVVSFNMLGTPYAVYRTPSAKLLAKYRQKRFDRIAEELNCLDVDVICLQEVHTYALLLKLRKRLTNFPHIKYQKFVYGPKGGVVTFSKLAIAASEYITFYKHGTFRNKSFVSKISRKGILLIKLADYPIYILNTHLTANIDWDWSSTNRYIPYIISQLEQLKDILKSLSHFPIEIIVAGDFNVPKSSSYYKSFLKNSKIIDVFKETNYFSYHPEHLPKGKTSECVDYIFLLRNSLPVTIVAKEQVFAEQVALNEKVTTFLSDHIGLKAQFEFILP